MKGDTMRLAAFAAVAALLGAGAYLAFTGGDRSGAASSGRTVAPAPASSARRSGTRSSA